MRKEKEVELKSYIKELSTKEKELTQSSHNFITIEQYQCYLNNGKTITRDKIMKNNQNGSAVLIFPITKEGNTVITIQPRVFTKSTVGIGLPAGYVEENETYEETARRELQEETGYIPDKLIECCAFYQDEGCSSAYNKGFIALGCRSTGKQHLDSSEYIKYVECTIEELLELVERGQITDGGSQLLIEKAKKYLKKEKKEGEEYV